MNDIPATSRYPQRTLAGGISVYPVGTGCWAIGGPDCNLGLPMGWSTADDTAALQGLETAWQSGANLFDTADIYGHGHSERLLGHLVSQVPREALVLSSKTGYFSGTAAHPYLPSAMRRQLETTLENLQTSCLDIYFLHNAEFGTDDQYLDGAVEQMRAFQEQGLIRAIGMRGPHRFATDRLTIANSTAKTNTPGSVTCSALSARATLPSVSTRSPRPRHPAKMTSSRSPPRTGLAC